MKNSAIAVIMIAALLMSDCATRGVVNNREPNFLVIIDKDFLKQRVEYKWHPWDLKTAGGTGAGGGGGGCGGGMAPGCAVVAAVICAIVMVYAVTYISIHNARGTNVSLTAVYENSPSETFELSWGINRFYLSEEKVASLENSTARLTLVATGTRNLEMVVPYGVLSKRDVHTIEFASDGKVLADGIV